MRPINNIVDVTNYVMLELGQPLHAFDRDHLATAGSSFAARDRARTIETLDHQQRHLDRGHAGHRRRRTRRGHGRDHRRRRQRSVSTDTTTLLLEGANFDMKSVRHTARALKLRTDASARFERGLDPNLVGPRDGTSDAPAAGTLARAPVSPPSRDVYPDPVNAVRSDDAVLADRARPRRPPRTRAESSRCLHDSDSRPGSLDRRDEQTLTVTVPTYRHDVTIPDDVVEEVARIVGYESLP